MESTERLFSPLFPGRIGISEYSIGFCGGNRTGAILGDPGADSGAQNEVKTGGKKFDEQVLSYFFPAHFDFVFGPTNCP